VENPEQVFNVNDGMEKEMGGQQNEGLDISAYPSPPRPRGAGNRTYEADPPSPPHAQAPNLVFDVAGGKLFTELVPLEGSRRRAAGYFSKLLSKLTFYSLEIMLIIHWHWRLYAHVQPRSIDFQSYRRN
jgi:hypothetical protein